MPTVESIAEREVPLISRMEIAAGLEEAIRVLCRAEFDCYGTEPTTMLRHARAHVRQSLDIEIAAILHGMVAQ